MYKKPTNRIQHRIMDALKETDTTQLTIAELQEKLEVSNVYVRQQIILLMESGLVEKVDQRQPYMYRVKVGDGKREQMVKVVRESLLATDKDLETMQVLNRPLLKLFRAAPKAKWSELIETFEYYEQAIDELNDEGKLIDTL